jgi:hypothetical protein
MTAVRTALAACESPEDALRLAFDNTDDRRGVVAEGVQAAVTLTRGTGSALVASLLPWPSPIEVAEQWSRGHLYWTSNDDTWRMVLYTGLLGLAPTFSFALGFGPRLVPNKNVRDVITVVLLHVAVVAAMWLWNRLQRRLLRRAAARLDEGAAFAIVLAELTRRTAAGAGSRGDFGRMMYMLRYGLDKLVRDQGKDREEPAPEHDGRGPRAA